MKQSEVSTEAVRFVTTLRHALSEVIQTQNDKYPRVLKFRELKARLVLSRHEGMERLLLGISSGLSDANNLWIAAMQHFIHQQQYCIVQLKFKGVA